MKHIELFKESFDSTVQEKIQPENWPYVGYSPAEGLIFTTILKPQPDNEIWYTSQNGDIVYFDDSLCNTTLVSNIYKDGKGIAKFKNPITYISSRNVQFVPSQDYGATFIGEGLLTLSLPNSLQRIETASLRRMNTSLSPIFMYLLDCEIMPFESCVATKQSPRLSRSQRK
jgi:hypothetical protein